MAEGGISPSFTPEETVSALELRESRRRWDAQSTALTIFGAVRLFSEGGNPQDMAPHLFNWEEPKSKAQEQQDRESLAQKQQLAQLMMMNKRKWDNAE